MLVKLYTIHTDNLEFRNGLVPLFGVLIMGFLVNAGPNFIRNKPNTRGTSTLPHIVHDKMTN